jgi:RNA polymerase sigma factor (sigma-70 family)
MHGTVEEPRGYGIGPIKHSIIRSKSLQSHLGNRFLIGRSVDFYPFDAEYVRRLGDGEAAVEEHFSIYFADRLAIKLRSRRRFAASDIDDIIQETFVRALQILRNDGLRKAESLGAFIFEICRRICLERIRPKPLDPLTDYLSQSLQGPDNQERDLLEAERSRTLWRAIDEMDSKDRRLLNAFFFKEQPKDEICETFGVNRNYLRVCLFRVKKTLKRRYLKKFDEKHKPNHDKKED